MKTRLGPRAPKFVEYTIEQPPLPTRQEVSNSVTQQIANWRFWKDYEAFLVRLREEMMKDDERPTDASDSEQESYTRKHKMVKEFFAEMQKKYSVVNPDIARVFGLPQFLLTALRRFDTSPIQIDTFTSETEQKLNMSLFYKKDVVLPFHERDGHLLPDFCGAFADELDVEERRQARDQPPALNFQNATRLKRQQEKDEVHSTEEAVEQSAEEESTTTKTLPRFSDPFYMDNKERLATYKAARPLQVRVILDRFGTGKFYEAMRHGTRSFTVICGKETPIEQSLHRFTHDRAINKWLSNLKSLPNDAWRAVDIERSIAIFLFSRLVHLHYFHRKFKNSTPYTYLTSQYGLGSYSKRVLYENCATGLEMVPYHTIVCLINEICKTIHDEGGSCSLVFSNAEEFSQVLHDQVISREGERTNLFVKMMEVVTDLDIDDLYILGSDVDLPRLVRTVKYGNPDREMELNVDANMTLVQDAKRMLMQYANIEDCAVVTGNMAPSEQHDATGIPAPHTFHTLPDVTSSNNREFLFRLRNCRPWTPITILNDLCMSGILAPLPHKNVFLKQSIHHAFYELTNVIKSQIQLTVHRSSHQEHLKDKLLTLYIYLFLFPRSTKTYPNTDRELDWVSVGLFPPNVESYVSSIEERRVNIPQEPAAFEALKLTVQDMGFIEDINHQMLQIMRREFFDQQRIGAIEAMLFHLLNNDVEKAPTMQQSFAPLLGETSTSGTLLSEEDSLPSSWMSNVRFSPEMIVTSEESGISAEEYWNAVKALTESNHREEFVPGDRDLPGQDPNLSESKIYHSLLGILSVEQLLFGISRDCYVWFTPYEKKIYGCVIDFSSHVNSGCTQVSATSVTHSHGVLVEQLRALSTQATSTIEDLIEGVLFLRITLNEQPDRQGSAASESKFVEHSVTAADLRSWVGESLIEALKE